MSKERLNPFSLIHIENKMTKGIDFKNLINKFADFKSRRKKIQVFHKDFRTFLNLYFSAEIPRKKVQKSNIIYQH